MVERFPEIGEFEIEREETDEEYSGRGKGAREEQRKIVRRQMAGILNNPPGTRQIWEEEHGVEHSPFEPKLGKKKGQGQRSAFYLQFYGSDWQRFLSPKFVYQKGIGYFQRDGFGCLGEPVFERARVRLLWQIPDVSELAREGLEFNGRELEPPIAVEGLIKVLEKSNLTNGQKMS